jgi:hypothetical protein
MSFCDKKNRLTTPFVPNSKIIFTLPMGGKILEGKVILTGQIVVTGETVPGRLVRPERCGGSTLLNIWAFLSSSLSSWLVSMVL